MQIAVLSGKGGTGKTFLSVNLAAAAKSAVYVDCDVEEPNGYLFLKPQKIKTVPVEVDIPEFDNEKCSGCRACMRFCRFNALVMIKGKPRLFPELCHSCSGCVLVCPCRAIHEVKRRVGVIDFGKRGEISVLTGTLDSGEATGVPVIRQLLKNVPAEETVIVDCPPGSSCTVMESIKQADYCLLVAEPTLFGAENMKLVVRLVKVFGKNCGIVINKDDNEKNNPIEKIAEENDLPILARIPYDRKLAESNARGEIAAENEKYARFFCELYRKIKRDPDAKRG